MNRARILLPLLALLSGIFSVSMAQINIGATEVDTSTVVTGLDTPWEILWGPDDHIWITERYGRVSRLNPETGELKELLAIDSVHEVGEGGLLGMVLHPDFSADPSVFLVYNYLDSSRLKERLVKYTYSDGILVSPVTLLEGIRGASNHDGSRLIIDDNLKLFMTTGDAAIPSISQDLNSLSGKVLRMNLDGSIPEDNPIPGSYIWSWGHRNAQGLVISPTGIMYSSEHGPSTDDEVNIIEKGRNYGWPDVKGFCDEIFENTFCADSNVFEPIAAWTPTLAVAGTDYYPHATIPEWHNSLLVTTLKDKKVVSLKLSEDGRSVIQEDIYFQKWFGRLRDICVSPDGRVFLAVSNKDGRGNIQPGDDRIVEIAARTESEYCNSFLEATICPGDTYDFNGQDLSYPGIYIDTISNTEGCDSIVSVALNFYEIQSIGLTDSVLIDLNDTITLTAQQGFASYSWNNNPSSEDNTFVLIGSELGEGTHIITIMAEETNGCTVADTVHVTVTANVGMSIYSTPVFSAYPNPLSGTELTIEYSIREEAVLVIYNQIGSKISRSILSPAQYTTSITIPDVGGMYFLKISNRNGNHHMKVLKK